MLPPRVRRAFRLSLHRSDHAETDTDDEIRGHLEMRVAALVARGMSPTQAEAEALRRFGSLPGAREKLQQAARRRERRLSLFERADELRRDMGYAVRQLRASPGFTLAVVLTFAIGMGANAAMFGIIDRLLLRGPAHVREPERLARFYYSVEEPGRGLFTGSHLGYVAYSALKDHVRSLDGVAAYSANEATLGRGAEALKIQEGHATADFFPLLGVQSHLGRFFVAEEDRPGSGQHVVVLSYALWRSRFGGDSAVLGRTISIGDEPYVVVGVAPKDFTGVEMQRVDLWIPMTVRGPRIHPEWSTTWNARWLQIIGRLGSGVRPESAAEEATARLLSAYDGDDPGMRLARGSFRAIGFDVRGGEPPQVAVARWLTGVAVVLLLIVCANIANLLLARALRRGREIAVRLALGAGVSRIVRMLLAESFLLAALGAVAGLAAADWGGQLIRVALLPDVPWGDSAIDARVLAFTAIAAVISAVLVGLVPAFQASRLDLTGGLKAGAREGGGRRTGLRGLLTVAQAALSAVLLVGAGLFVRSLRNVDAVHHGIELDRVLVADIHWPNLPASAVEADWDRLRARKNAFYQVALERIQRLPGVERASVAIGTPFHGGLSLGIAVPGLDSIPAMPGGGPWVSAVSSDHFTTVGTRVLRGRGFTPADRAGSERVMVVNETMAERLWPQEDPLGKCVKVMSEPCARVVGVVEDARRSALDEPRAMQYYVPLGQQTSIGGATILIRPRCGEAARCAVRMADLVRSELLRIDPTLGFIDVAPLERGLELQVRPWRLGATMFGIFGAIALVVAALGLYSVIAYGVAQRSHELGVRVALGAQRRAIVWLILRQGMVAAAMGVAIGLTMALVAAPFLQPLLFRVPADDPVVFGLVAMTLLAVAVGATILPALRGARSDPMRALQAE
jgi:predicted permease